MTQEHFVKMDSHAHLTSDELFDDAEKIIQRANLAKVQRIINITTDQNTLQRGLELKKKFPKIIYNTAATTPHDVDKEGEVFFPIVEKTAKEGNLVAIGETGLDSYYQHSDALNQKKYLKRYIDLAVECELPLVIHCRGDEAFSELFTIAKTYPKINAVIHCFTGSSDQALEAIELGWYLSISGIVTFKKSTELRETLIDIPLDRLFIETDSPYLAPQCYRGKVNEPAYVGEVAKTIAEEKGITLEQVCEVTSKNSCAFFRI